ncbi:DUF2780 domain-containing protein [Fulvimarina sp. MAC8]|uniref:DUF2780 domain-containing protein n=1 Tax=Fulvimarina sp. MAC8 TaxID=3162874 RepID=UPI0032EE784B
MEQLLTRISSEAGLDAQTAKAAVGHILAFIKAQGEGPEVDQMLGAMPGSEDAIVEAGKTQTGSGGLLGGLMGSLAGSSAIMALGSKLTGLGLDVEQIRTVAKELVTFAKQHAGEETVDRALKSVPGLSDYM